MDAEVWNDSPRLRAWLRGEYGVRWSFVVVQLDSRGNEVRRITAPHTGPTPRAYLPIEIDEALLNDCCSSSQTSRTPCQTPTKPTRVERAFELIVDRSDD